MREGFDSRHRHFFKKWQKTAKTALLSGFQGIARGIKSTQNVKFDSQSIIFDNEMQHEIATRTTTEKTGPKVRFFIYGHTCQ